MEVVSEKLLKETTMPNKNMFTFPNKVDVFVLF